MRWEAEIRTVALTVAAAASLACTPAEAQVNYGAAFAMVDQMREQQCMAGRPPTPGIVRMLEGKAAGLMAKYIDYAAASDTKRLSKLFVGTRGRWRSGEDVRDLRTLSDPFLAGAPRGQIKIRQKAFVAGGDHETGRGIWEVTLGEGPEARTLEYAFDMAPNEWGFWRILHMSVYAEPEQAIPPRPFCHLYLTDSY